MTEPHPQHPVPGSQHPVPGPPRPVPALPRDDALGSEQPADPFAGLAGQPVAEHVAVYEAEHDRLRRELSTIDQL
ncbi:hypothetical protein GCM10027300_38550 [Modestobacter lapidis]|nr:hypothetical protein [Modestobacter lapidis]